MTSLRKLGVLAGLLLVSLLAVAAEIDVRADKIVALSDGGTHFSGSVVVTAPDKSAEFRANKITTAANEIVLEGNVRFVIGNTVFRTDRAIVTKSAQFEAKMDEATSSSL